MPDRTDVLQRLRGWGRRPGALTARTAPSGRHRLRARLYAALRGRRRGDLRRPAVPMRKSPPLAPMQRMLPALPIERMEPALPMERMLPELPMQRMLPALPIERMEKKLAREPMLPKLNRLCRLRALSRPRMGAFYARPAPRCRGRAGVGVGGSRPAGRGRAGVGRGNRPARPGRAGVGMVTYGAAMKVNEALTAATLRPKAERLLALSAEKIKALEATWEPSRGRRCSPSGARTPRGAGRSGRRASSSARPCCSSTPPATRSSSRSAGAGRWR